MKHYQTRIAFAEKEIKRLAQQLSKFNEFQYLDVDDYLKRMNKANRIRNYYLAENYKYLRTRWKNKK